MFSQPNKPSAPGGIFPSATPAKRGLTFGCYLVVALFVLCVVASGCARQDRSGSGKRSSLGQNSVAPDFVLKDLSGKEVRLSDYRGHAVLLEFWATWCPPCRETIPELIALHDKYGSRGLIILGIAVDENPDMPQGLIDFAREHHINYPILIGTEGVESLYNVVGIPRSVLIDKQGRIAQSYMGYIDNFSELVSKKVDEII